MTRNETPWLRWRVSVECHAGCRCRIIRLADNQQGTVGLNGARKINLFRCSKDRLFRTLGSLANAAPIQASRVSSASAPLVFEAVTIELG